MNYELTPIEARLLGALIEKEMSTPDYYPLTLNALINACNQKSNRDPVMALDEGAVETALHSLRHQHLVWQVKTHGSRALKYEHNMKEAAEFNKMEVAILCELLLREPQTPGELRSRSARLLGEPPGLSAVERALEKLAAHENGPFVLERPRRPGQKENRFVHLFCKVDPEEASFEFAAPAADVPDVPFENDRVAKLEERVADLESALGALKLQFEAFREQFE